MQEYKLKKFVAVTKENKVSEMWVTLFKRFSLHWLNSFKDGANKHIFGDEFKPVF